MYESFYGFREKPFNLTPDPRFLYLSSAHRDALAYLTYGLTERKGFLVVVGEAGTGKTTLARTVVERFSENTSLAFILSTKLNMKQLLTLALHDLGIKVRGLNKVELLMAFNDYLLEQSSQGRNVVLLIDEAQNLTLDVLEELRMLSNLETTREKLLQIVLLGQPELLDTPGAAGASPASPARSRDCLAAPPDIRGSGALPGKSPPGGGRGPGASCARHRSGSAPPDRRHSPPDQHAGRPNAPAWIRGRRRKT